MPHQNWRFVKELYQIHIFDSIYKYHVRYIWTARMATWEIPGASPRKPSDYQIYESEAWQNLYDQ